MPHNCISPVFRVEHPMNSLFSFWYEKVSQLLFARKTAEKLRKDLLLIVRVKVADRNGMNTNRRRLEFTKKNAQIRIKTTQSLYFDFWRFFLIIEFDWLIGHSYIFHSYLSHFLDDRMIAEIVGVTGIKRSTSLVRLHYCTRHVFCVLCLHLQQIE